jgi:hypothetical protein
VELGAGADVAALALALGIGSAMVSRLLVTPVARRDRTRNSPAIPA